MRLIAVRDLQELYEMRDGSAVILDHDRLQAFFPPSVQAALKQGYWEVPSGDDGLILTEKHLSGKHNQQTHAGGRGSAEPPAQIGNVTWKGEDITVEDRDDSKSALSSILGKDLSDKDVAALVGAPDGSYIDMFREGDSVVLNVSHEWYDEDADSQERRISKIGDAVVMTNDTFTLYDDAPEGLGTAVFAHQVKAAKSLGVSKITTSASGDREFGHNGYYTWPRLGYDGELPSQMPVSLPKHLKGARKVSDLMRTPEGRDWWKKYGFTLDVEFDLSDGSESLKTLDEYIAKRFG